LGVREISAWGLNGSVDDRELSRLAMKFERLPEIMVRAVWDCRFGKEEMCESSCHDSEVITLTLDLLNCMQALECLVVSIMLFKRCRQELSAKLLMYSIEQDLSGGMDFLNVGRKFSIFVRDKIDIVVPCDSKPRACI
jgi:hypothetical protein